MSEFSEPLKAWLEENKRWMTYRGHNHLFFPSDPRWKGLEWRNSHDSVRVEVNKKLVELWSGLELWERYLLDPEWHGGLGFLRETYELKVLLRKQGQPLEYGWPDPLCSLIGHLAPYGTEIVRFVCMNCWKMYDRDPSDGNVIVGGPDEAWIVQSTDQARSDAQSASTSGVPG